MNTSLSYTDTLDKIDCLKKTLRLDKRHIFFHNHHVSHAYAALTFNGFPKSEILILDGFGENASGLIASFEKNQGLFIKKILPPSKSIGLFYSAITAFCGFKVLTGEYKLMGLASYGTPIYYEKLCDYFGNPNIKEFSTKKLKFFGQKLYDKSLEKILGFEARCPGGQINTCYKDLASSAQKFLEKFTAL